jgi:micrococcal nuclease
MVSKKRLVFILIVLVVLLIALNYSKLDSMTGKFVDSSETGVVNKVVDGDTIDVAGQRVRLLGINTPEKGELYYQEAKDFVMKKIMNKSVRLESGKEDKDLYSRELRYVFLNDENINLELVQNGLANIYFPSGKDRYYNTFLNACQECIIKNINLCEKSENPCANCVKLDDLNVKNQIVVLRNICSAGCELTNWGIKDEGRKNFVFPKFTLLNQIQIKVGEGQNNQNVLFWSGQDYVWTDTGDTIFLRDSDGKLVLWQSY